MNIIFLTMIDIRSLDQKNIYTDLVRELSISGHTITMISPLERRNGKSDQLIKGKYGNILKVATGNLFETSKIEKGISTITLEGKFVSAIKRYIGKDKVDLVIYSTPPITFAKAVKYIKYAYGAKSYLLLKDIFPQNAVDLKIIRKKSIVYWFFRKKEIQLYFLSDYIGCMSEANRKYLLNHNSIMNQTEICPNTITPKQYNLTSDERIQKQSKIKLEFNIPENAKVFLYGGNLGKPQGIDFIIKSLELLKDRKDVFFIICGNGTEYSKLNNWVKNRSAKNVCLMPWLEKEKYDNIMMGCDVGLIFLDHRFTIPNFPSRMLAYMEAGLPILAATDMTTDIGHIIEENGFGFWCESLDPKDFVDKVDEILLDDELRMEMGRKGRLYLEENYTSQTAARIILEHFKE